MAQSRTHGRKRKNMTKERLTEIAFIENPRNQSKREKEEFLMVIRSSRSTGSIGGGGCLASCEFPDSIDE